MNDDQTTGPRPDADPEQSTDPAAGAGTVPGSGEAPGTTREGRATRPTTGDRAVDDALAAFDRTLAQGPAAQVEAATEAHRALQARLTSPPTEAAPPHGEARPGPHR